MHTRLLVIERRSLRSGCWISQRLLGWAVYPVILKFPASVGLARGRGFPLFLPAAHNSGHRGVYAQSLGTDAAVEWPGRREARRKGRFRLKWAVRLNTMAA